MRKRLLLVPPPDSMRMAPLSITQDQAMAITGRTRRTVLRWIRCGRVGDPAALQLLQVECFGLVPGRAWRGWRVHGGDMVGPDGDLWRVEDLRAAAVTAQLVSALRGRCADLEAQLDAVRAEAAETPLTRLGRWLAR